jgi:hypothetical protein
MQKWGGTLALLMCFLQSGGKGHNIDGLQGQEDDGWVNKGRWGPYYVRFCLLAGTLPLEPYP